MISIRKYRESDSAAVGRLIADTFQHYNLSYASPEEQRQLLGPFRHARSRRKSHQQEIASVIAAPMMFVAVYNRSRIVGILRGSKNKMRSLFVDGRMHRLGIGRQLVRHFETECRFHGAEVIRLAATLYAVRFYENLGYKKSTGIRVTDCFDGTGLKYQPMKKRLD